MDGRQLLESNLALVQRAIAHTCRRQRLDHDEAEEFAAVVRLKLIENDYAVLRKFEGRSTLSTYIAVVVQRLLLDFRISHWGKWHPSADAKRLGEVAIELEKVIHRDGRSLFEARAILEPRFGSLPNLAELAAKLPERPPRRRSVALDEAESVAVPPDDDSHERRNASRKVSAIVQQFLDDLPPEDKLIVKLRFDAGMTVAQIARSLRLDQKNLYRRIERHLSALRVELERNGLAASEVADLIGARNVLLDFGFSGAVPREEESP